MSAFGNFWGAKGRSYEMQAPTGGQKTWTVNPDLMEKNGWYKTGNSKLVWSVICTELYRRGELSDAIWQADGEFGAKQSPQLMAGYHFWAKPVVKLMQRSEAVYRIVRVPALRWAQYMAFKQGVTTKSDLIGAVIHNLGAPLCVVLGTFVLLFKKSAATEQI